MADSAETKGPMAELLTEPTNFAVIQLPGRRFPGVVFQGDSLGSLCADLRAALAEKEATDIRSEIEAIVSDLDQVLRAYLDVLDGRGQGSPTTYRPPLP